MGFTWRPRDPDSIWEATDRHCICQWSLELNVQYSSQKVPGIPVEANGNWEEWDHGKVSSQIDQKPWGPRSKFQ